MIEVNLTDGSAFHLLSVVTETFPCGESLVKFDLQEDVNKIKYTDMHIVILFKWSSNNDLIQLLLIVDSIRSINPLIDIHLSMAYFPYGRQDRVSNPGEPNSTRVIASLINSCNFKVVYVIDPHSDVIEASINNIVIVHQHELFVDYFDDKFCKYDAVVCPDAGAYKKVTQFAKLMNVSGHRIGIVRADKSRDTMTGAITSIDVNATKEDIEDNTFMILDDICDGGGTFVGLAKKLKEMGAYQVDLFVTHGMFTKGVDNMLKHIDNIYCWGFYGDKSFKDKISVVGGSVYERS